MAVTARPTPALVADFLTMRSIMRVQSGVSAWRPGSTKADPSLRVLPHAKSGRSEAGNGISRGGASAKASEEAM